MSGRLVSGDAVRPAGAAPIDRHDRLAIAAAYNQLFLFAGGCPADVRAAVCALTPGRAAYAGLVALGGIAYFLGESAARDDPVYQQLAELVRTACAGSGYPPPPEAGGPQEVGS